MQTALQSETEEQRYTPVAPARNACSANAPVHEGTCRVSVRCSPQEVGCSDERRFLLELEFVQCLSSPQYLNCMWNFHKSCCQESIISHASVAWPSDSSMQGSLKTVSLKMLHSSTIWHISSTGNSQNMLVSSCKLAGHSSVVWQDYQGWLSACCLDADTLIHYFS